MQVKIYHYHAKTKEYLYESFSDKNPLNPDEPIIPAFATTIQPLEIKSGKAIVWVGNKWEYKEDHRDEIWYNAKTSNIEKIDFIGEIPSYYFSVDSNRANKPEGNYWEYDSDNDTWVGNLGLYKTYIEQTMSFVWDIKQETPFEFEGHKFLPNWKEQYMSIWNSLNSGFKTEFKIRDYDGVYINVTKDSFKPIVQKIIEVNDEMVLDKAQIKDYIVKSNDFNKLEEKYNNWLKKIYN